MRRARHVLTLCLTPFVVLIVSASSVSADARTDRLLAALGMNDMIAIMREEGLEYAQKLAADMLPGGNTVTWTRNVERIYDETAMRLLVKGGFAQALSNTDISDIEAYFDTPEGKRLIELEISARRAMLDPDIEEAAKARARDLKDASDPDYALIGDLITAGDMLDANVVSALNSNILFYNGLVDGGAFKMSEEEIVSDVWSQEDETRAETSDWLFGYFLMAYDPLPRDEIEAFVTFSSTPSGQALTRALFAAYDGMFSDISYALGLAVAREMQAEEI